MQPLCVRDEGCLAVCVYVRQDTRVFSQNSVSIVGGHKSSPAIPCCYSGNPEPHGMNVQAFCSPYHRISTNVFSWGTNGLPWTEDEIAEMG